MSTLAERQLYFQEANRWFVETMVNLASQYQAKPEQLQSHQGSLLSALQQAFDNHLNDLFIQGTFAMSRFWETFGDYKIALVFHERCTQAAHTNEAKARALFNHSYISEKQGDYEKSLLLCETGLTQARKTDNKYLIVDLIWQVSRMKIKMGRIESGEQLINEGLKLAESVDYQERLGWLLNVVGFVADNFHSDYARAESLYKRAIPIAISQHSQELLGDLYLNLSIIYVRKGMYELAKEQLEEALTIAQQIGHREQICYILLNLGVVQANLNKDNLDFTLAYIEKAMAVAHEIGHLELLGMAYMHTGSIATMNKQFDLAANYFSQAHSYFSKIGNTIFMAGVLTEQGKLYIASEQWEKAWEFYIEALAFIQANNLQEFEGKALFGLAQAAAGQGNLTKAKELGTESLALLQRIQNENADEVGEWLSALLDEG